MTGWKQEVLWHHRLEKPDRPIHKTLTLSIMEGLPTALLFLKPFSSFLPYASPISHCTLVCDYCKSSPFNFSFLLRLCIYISFGKNLRVCRSSNTRLTTFSEVFVKRLFSRLRSSDSPVFNKEETKANSSKGAVWWGHVVTDGGESTGRRKRKEVEYRATAERQVPACRFKPHGPSRCWEHQTL